MEIDSVSFGAIPINTVTIKKYNIKTKKFQSIKTSFIKLEHDNENDMEAIKSAANKWRNATYIRKIASASRWMGIQDLVNIEVYALTRQTKNFKKLNYGNLLGFAEMRSDYNNPKKAILNHLQVKPNAMNLNQQKNKKYQRVGTSIIKSLQKQYNEIALFSVFDTKTERFYKRLGFIRDSIANNHFVWNKSFLERLKLYYRVFIDLSQRF